MEDDDVGIQELFGPHQDEHSINNQLKGVIPATVGLHAIKQSHLFFFLVDILQPLSIGQRMGP
jgi:hypothetical protein